MSVYASRLMVIWNGPRFKINHEHFKITVYIEIVMKTINIHTNRIHIKGYLLDFNIIHTINQTTKKKLSRIIK